MLTESEVAEVRRHLETTFEQRLFEATIAQVARADDPLRANNFAYALRELSRHVLKRLSPDGEVQDAPWFAWAKNERGDDVISRHQRMKFAIQGYLEDDFITNTLAISYDDEIKALKHAIDKLSKYTHVESETFGVSPEEVEKLCNGALSALADLFRSMFDCRERTLAAVADKVDETVVEHAVESTLEDWYDFATHYTLDEVDVDDLTCTGYHGDEIYGEVSGLVSVTLQYGSAGDRRRGDGLEVDASAPFSCKVVISTSDLSDVSIEPDSFRLDMEEFSKEWRSGADSEEDEDEDEGEDMDAEFERLITKD